MRARGVGEGRETYRERRGADDRDWLRFMIAGYVPLGSFGRIERGMMSNYDAGLLGRAFAVRSRNNDQLYRARCWRVLNHGSRFVNDKTRIRQWGITTYDRSVVTLNNGGWVPRVWNEEHQNFFDERWA